MPSIQDLIDQVRQVLILTGGTLPKEEIYNRFVNESNVLELTELDFYKTILKPATKGLDLDEIERNFREKQAAEAQRKATEAQTASTEPQKKLASLDNAPATIDQLVKQVFDNDLVKGEDLKKIFDKAASLGQNLTQLALQINQLLDDAVYRPYPRANFDAGSLRETLTSTDWYNPALYAAITAPPPPKPKRRNGAKIVAATVLLLVAGGAAFYFGWYRGYLKDKNATRMYSYANSLAQRSSPSTASDQNIVGNLKYGAEVKVYSSTSDWVEGKVNDTEGYVSTQFLLSKKEFYELDGIFADADTRDAIPTTKCRKALLDYFNTKGIMGKIDETIQKEIYGTVQQKEIWQVFAKAGSRKPNNVIYPRVVNPLSKFTDFGCIIKNMVTGQRKFLLFSFDDNEQATLESEQDAPGDGYIQSVGRLPYPVQYAF